MVSATRPTEPAAADRTRVVRRGLVLTYATVAYNSLEGVIAIAAGLGARSVVLVGFGFDSLIELTAGTAAIWRLHMDAGPLRERAERIAHRVVGVCFLTLAVYVTADSLRVLIAGHRPEESRVGIVLASASLIVMPLLARAKRRVALAMTSGALVAEARQTMLCTYLSAILLGGLVLNAVFGWWWADPIAALAMVPIITKEGIDGVKGRSTCECP